MAVDGRKMSDNSILPAETLEENVCAPCAQDNRRVSAVRFCVECNENVCEKCVADHLKYGGMKGHQIMDTIRTDKDQKRVTYPSQRCTKHGGKVIDVFCADHDFVGCATCIAVEHRCCVNVKFIPDMANKELTDTLLDDLNFKFAELIKRVDALKKAKQDCVEQLSKAKEQVVLEVKELRQKLTEKLDQMEKETLDHTDDFFEKKQQSIDKLLNNIDDTRSKLLEARESLHSRQDSNVPTIFVESKRSQSVLCDDARTVDSLEQSHCVVPVTFHVCQEFENIFHLLTKFGYLSEMPTLRALGSSSEYNIRLSDDNYSCEIRDVCVTKGGDIVLTDMANNKVKLFDSNFTLKDSQHTSGSPYGVTEIDDDRLAVSLIDKQIIQILLQNPLRLERSWSVEDRCRGLTFYKGNIYVCCGGAPKYGPGCIKVYNLQGSLKMLYCGPFKAPWYIYIPDSGKLMFCSDLEIKTIIVTDLSNGTTLKMVTFENISSSGISKIHSTKQISVACFQPYKIVLINENLETRELLTEENGIFKPRSLAYDHRKNAFIVPKDSSDYVNVFKFLD